MHTEIPAGIGKGRVEALADGVFAIALTLLILDIKVPVLSPQEGSEDLFRKLLALWPKFLAFIVSFLIIGVYWVGHHALLHYIRHSDRHFLWMNLLFLLVISAMPFSTALLSEHHQYSAAVVVYCGNLIVAGLVLFAQLRYAAGRGELFDPDLDAAFPPSRRTPPAHWSGRVRRRSGLGVYSHGTQPHPLRPGAGPLHSSRTSG
jgi:uncharacterized membrane protein